MFYELCGKFKITVAEILSNIKAEKVVGYKKEQMTILQIFYYLKD
jgi:hypothetical protein